MEKKGKADDKKKGKAGNKDDVKSKESEEKGKRPLSGYNLFSKEERPILKKDIPDIKPKDIMGEIAKRWKALSEDQRKKWNDRALDEKGKADNANKSDKKKPSKAKKDDKKPKKPKKNAGEDDSDDE